MKQLTAEGDGVTVSDLALIQRIAASSCCCSLLFL